MLKFYLDEDVPSALLHALRAHGIDAVSTATEERYGSPDDEQLTFATSQRRVIVTCNVGDFTALHRETLAAGQSHAGIVAISVQRFPPGEYAAALARLSEQITPDEMTDRMEYLSAWL